MPTVKCNICGTRFRRPTNRHHCPRCEKATGVTTIDRHEDGFDPTLLVLGVLLLGEATDPVAADASGTGECPGFVPDSSPPDAEDRSSPSGGGDFGGGGASDSYSGGDSSGGFGGGGFGD